MIEDRIKIEAFYDELNKIASKNELKSSIPWTLARGTSSAASGYLFLRLLEPLLSRIKQAPVKGGPMARELARSKYLIPASIMLGIAGAAEGMLESRIEGRVERQLK